MSKTVGVYLIRNINTARVYIGSSTKDVNHRIRQHKYDLKRGEHPNRHLQSAFSVWGFDGFRFELIERVENPDLVLAREQFHIDRLQTTDPRFGYNLAPQAGNCRGVKHSPEARARMSASAKKRGCCLTPEGKERALAALRSAREKLGHAPALGYRHTDDAKARMTKARRGKPSNAKGRKLSPEHIEALRRANLGHKRNIGQKVSAETRAKLSAVLKRRARADRRKLSDVQVRCLRVLRLAGVPYSRLGKLFNLSIASAYHAARGDSYASLTLN